MLRQNSNAGIHSGLVLHTGADNRALGLEQRHSLTLHVRAHQRTVRVIVLQEGDHGGRYRQYHLRRYVHEVHTAAVRFHNHITVTAGNTLVGEGAFLGEGFVGLRNHILIFHISSHVDNFVQHLAGGLVHTAVGSLDEAVLVDAGKGCQVGDQTDVRAFRGLNGTHASIVGVVYISNLESGAVTGQTAGAQGRQTTLMGQFCQRVGLVHELGQRRGAEELLDGSHNRTDVDQRLGCDDIHILGLGSHTLPDHTLHTGEADAELVLQQLTNRTDTAVAQVVNIVHGADALDQTAHIVDGGKDIVNDDVLGDQVVPTGADSFPQALLILILLEDLTQHREADLLIDAVFLAV